MEPRPKPRPKRRPMSNQNQVPRPTPAMMRDQPSPGPDALVVAAHYESVRTQAYQDPGGIWTIGYGHTGPEVVQGSIVTLDGAATLLQTDMQRAGDGVRDLVTYPLEQGQMDALADFAFNLGKWRLK